jgi:2-oxoisovalerate dehydrogenase E1 component alpha subunit
MCEESVEEKAQVKSRHAALGLTDEDVLAMYETMVLSRALDERMWVLQRAGKAAFVISGQGHEGAQVGAAWTLRPGHDFLHPYYRDLAMCLVLGMTPREVMLSLLAKAEDPTSGGRQMPGHWGHPKLKIISGSSPVGTQIPQAAGLALASKIRGEDVVTLVSFGEGATSTGDFHEGLNFAGIHKLPVVFFCENNQYAISVSLDKQVAGGSVAARAACYGFPGAQVDGMDVLAVYEVVQEAVARARRGEGPTLVEALVYRFVPHSSDDRDTLYRSREEIQAWRERDPISMLGSYLREAGLLTNELEAEIQARVKVQVNDATDYAEAAPYPRTEDLMKHVYAERGG